MPQTSEQILAALRRLSDDKRVVDLLEVSLGRVLAKAATRGESRRSDFSSEQGRHIADWIAAALVNDEAWLTNTDDSGRPRKLMKFGSVRAILAEVDKAMLKAARSTDRQALDADHEVFVAELRDGFHVVRMLTPSALDQESAQMQHCIGNGRYDRLLTDPERVYLSLRDRSGKSHATIEVVRGAVHQLRGKQNRAPDAKYLALLDPWFTDAFDIGPSGYVRVRNVGLLPLSDVPAGGVIMGSLSFTEVCIELPSDVVIEGDLTLQCCDIVACPRSIVAGGSIVMTGWELPTVPEVLRAGGEIALAHAEHARRPPRECTAGGSVSFQDAGFSELPEVFSFDGDLNISGSSITNIDGVRKVAGRLWINGGKVARLPEGLVVGGDFKARHSALIELPKGFACGGKIDVTGSKAANEPGPVVKSGKDLALPADFASSGVALEVREFGLGETLQIDGASLRLYVYRPPYTQIASLWEKADGTWFALAALHHADKIEAGPFPDMAAATAWVQFAHDTNDARLAQDPKLTRFDVLWFDRKATIGDLARLVALCDLRGERLFTRGNDEDGWFTKPISGGFREWLTGRAPHHSIILHEGPYFLTNPEFLDEVATALPVREQPPEFFLSRETRIDLPG